MIENASGNEELKKIIVERIKREGKITFAQFMELALYYPQLGYYASTHPRIGRQGDFYTSPHVHPMFGALLGKQIEEMWRFTGAGKGFSIIEFGAGCGVLAADILRVMSPAFAAGARYIIVEINRHMIETQRQWLSNVQAPGCGVEWVRSLEDLRKRYPCLVGCILSNELIDSFPAHRVKRKGRRLLEIYVGVKGNRIVEILDELSTPEVERYVVENGIRLADGQEIEVNLRALEWLEGVAALLEKGFVLTIDYGYESRDLLGQRFFNGSLMGYRKHKISHNPYEAIGTQDLTAHVNFTALMNRGKDVGLETTGFTSQLNFLLALASGGLSDIAEGSSPGYYKNMLALKQLMMPGGMGEVFRVLIQHKGLERPNLTGLRKPW